MISNRIWYGTGTVPIVLLVTMTSIKVTSGFVLEPNEKSFHFGVGPVVADPRAFYADPNQDFKKLYP